ncbi:HTTM domain-containing protein [Enhygromyxa salina]|uniref:Vitamin K-dependent gamma-carboxylase n=1 Tax=Enhygromyxa salina TaxID=215803 RepID=A0A2S9YDY8_9BACT|nr:HTTM domain-containing protein [Enhygromyxa salina]PRQ03226.1 hypothetical protein ENSA7_53030 [Enhygromyxa salina]
MKPLLDTCGRAWIRFWHAPIDPAPLAAFRQAFAWTLLIYFVAWARSADEWLTDAGYHPPASLDPINAPHLPLLPASALPFVGAIVFGCLLAFIFGYARRVVVWVLVAAAIHALLVDPIAAFTINRLFVIGLFILAIAPEPDMPDSQPVQRAWPTRMLQVLVVSQYFASGLCKTLNGDWWGGEDVLWMQVQGIYMTDAAAWLVRTLPHWAWTVQQQLALWFELLAPILFGVKKLRPLAFVLGLGLHLVVAVTMDQLIYFSLQMACFYLLFIPPEWARRLAPGGPR